MDDKVYTQEIVPTTPFPGEIAQFVTSSSPANVGDMYSPTVSKAKVFPIKRTAVELLSTALNTRSRKILQEFELQQSGGFQVGNFEEGLSGDLRITPGGLVARNIAGITTFAIDGDTGDAFFAGQLRSGTLITGELTIGDGSIVLDELGLRSTTAFLNSITTRGTPETFTTDSYVDNTGSSQTFILERSTNILLSVKAEMYITESAGNTGSAALYIDINGTISNNGIIFVGTGNNATHTYSVQYIVTLPAGTHTIKLKSRFEGPPTGSPVFNVSQFYFTRLHLGS